MQCIAFVQAFGFELKWKAMVFDEADDAVYAACTARGGGLGDKTAASAVTKSFQ